MTSHAHAFQVNVSTALTVDRFEASYIQEYDLLNHSLEACSKEDAQAEGTWNVHYCGLHKKAGEYLVRCQHSLGDIGESVRYFESSFSMLSDGDFGLTTVAKALLVPVPSKGIGTTSKVEIVQGGKTVLAFDGAHLFVNKERMELTIVVITQDGPSETPPNAQWVDLAAIRDSDLSFVLRCLKALGG